MAETTEPNTTNDGSTVNSSNAQSSAASLRSQTLDVLNGSTKDCRIEETSLSSFDHAVPNSMLSSGGSVKSLKFDGRNTKRKLPSGEKAGTGKK